jgi:molybdopterin molybdotransferase
LKQRTRLDAARTALEQRVGPLDRSEHVSLAAADGRVLAGPITAQRDVPHYRRAAMDGYAVRAVDTHGATDRSPARLDVEAEPGAGAATRIDTGSEVPERADAVVPIEAVDRTDGGLDVFAPATEGANVAPVGEDVTAGEPLFEAGDQLGPAALGLLKSIGVDEVSVRPRPTVGVVPTGEELVQRDPDPGESVETSGFLVSKLVERWGGRAAYREIVGDDRDAIRAAIQRELTKDVIVTTGGSSVGTRDLVPDVVDDLGEVFVHGVALQPGHPVALGVVEETPVLVLPGYPVACLVTAVQFLHPTLRWLRGQQPVEYPTAPARLARKLPSEPGVRTFARVAFDTEDGQRVARPIHTSGAGVLSSAALADGWIEIQDSREGLPDGDIVAVQHWEWSA